MACSCHEFADAAERQFTAKKAAKELQHYRRAGVDPTTRMLRDGLVEAGLSAGSLLDVGAGIGALTFELLDRGISAAVVVEASSAYLAAGRDEAARRGRAAIVQSVHGDFLSVSKTVSRADVVTLDRVVCCYPLFEPLLEQALTHADRYFAFSYPRDVWYVRWAVAVENGVRWLWRNPFRVFVHPPGRMTHMVEHAGFTLAARHEDRQWCADVFVRLNSGDRHHVDRTRG